jgi:hypothetical protein
MVKDNPSTVRQFKETVAQSLENLSPNVVFKPLAALIRAPWAVQRLLLRAATFLVVYPVLAVLIGLFLIGKFSAATGLPVGNFVATNLGLSAMISKAHDDVLNLERQDREDDDMILDGASLWQFIVSPEDQAQESFVTQIFKDREVNFLTFQRITPNINLDKSCPYTSLKDIQAADRDHHRLGTLSIHGIGLGDLVAPDVKRTDEDELISVLTLDSDQWKAIDRKIAQSPNPNVSTLNLELQFIPSGAMLDASKCAKITVSIIMTYSKKSISVVGGKGG